MRNRLLSMIFVMSFVVILVSSVVSADSEPYIESIKVLEDPIMTPSYPPAIGASSQFFYVEVYMSDGTINTNTTYNDMEWTVEKYIGNGKFEVVNNGIDIRNEGSKLYFWQPYGTEEGQYKVTARSKVDSDASGYTFYQLYYPWYSETFCMFFPGTVKYGKVKTKAGDVASVYTNAIKAKDIKETYNWDTQKYTCILPSSPYKANDYTFVGWKKDGGKDNGKIFKSGATYVSPARNSDEWERNAYFEAQWKPNFKSPELVVNKSGKNIKLKWNRMIGGKGYKIYRATQKNGKYKLIKTINGKTKTTWTDKKIKNGKKYYYKVAAYKKSKGKLVQKKSVWAMTSTKAAKVKSVKLNKASIKGKAGKTTKVKAKVKMTGGKKLSQKVRWYTSNKNVAKINRNTGKITFIKAGTCQIWAKAYNGKTSSKIKVIVAR